MSNFQVEMLDVEEAAEVANLTVPHLRELLRQGKVKGIKTGRKWRISKEELNNYLGIKTDTKSFEREMYIKELESENKELKLKLTVAKSSIENLLSVM
ncbi:MAG: helix-turn-helix domain-containing protein [Clostridium sp.]|uniref:helix-turn-helix domain-containing protein n=1 Tax=Clostridium TaxID=1485 RepID=UPI00232AE269|nr:MULTISPECIES: helix-turn-helix domain-containing protein [Clostridium]MBS5927205.1 helix-turn-helix domain-containing protein [Clostridium sp.]MDB2101778.1 helix-turn-helix domain-containing protein [Clostridium paraputrificum]MDB2118938.1 helix-turn-helix domain-containing protein [Clostridium paraputrificum]MDU2108608.1 helix-turn-helix domain-containing protein [Clostridium sp.]MDU2756832.1 helix-turn-helix domain-containing protein [Clostridium sp.]